MSPTFFFILKMILIKNMFNIDFLKFYYHKLCYEPGQLFDEGQSTIKCFFHQEYEFRGGGGLDIWGNLESLSESTRYSKKLKIAKLKAEKLPIPAES